LKNNFFLNVYSGRNLPTLRRNWNDIPWSGRQHASPKQ